MKVLKKIIAVICSIILWGIILLTALFTFTTLATRNNNQIASLAGYTPLLVQSDSMAPTFAAGDLIIIRSCDTKTLKEGDIITFHTILNNEYALNTHRIMEITENEGHRSYLTKGDNNEIADIHSILDGDIVGVYVAKSTVLGRILNFLSSKIGFLVVIVLPMLVFFIYQVYHLVMVSIQLKKAAAAEEYEEKAKQAAEAEAKLAEAEAVLAEAKRLKAEAEAKLAESGEDKDK